jgi:hypothetical protein
MVWADPAFPQYRKIIVDQFVRLARIGADGVHVDKMFPSSIDYNPDLPMSPDTGPWEGAILLTKEVFAACRKYTPDWAMSFECNWDRMLQFTASKWWGGAIGGFVFPENVGMVGITAAFDYLGVNNAVCGRSTGLVGPMNFCRSVGWEPWQGLAAYIKEVKRIQDTLADSVWLGEELGQQGVRFEGGAAVAYYVFRNPATGRRVCILSNSSRDTKKASLQSFDPNRAGQVRVHAPFKKANLVTLPAPIEVPGERIVFVEELLGIDHVEMVAPPPEPHLPRVHQHASVLARRSGARADLPLSPGNAQAVGGTVCPATASLGLLRRPCCGEPAGGAEAGADSGQFPDHARGRQLAPPQRTERAAGRDQRVFCRIRQRARLQDLRSAARAGLLPRRRVARGSKDPREMEIAERTEYHTEIENQL